MSLNVTAEYGRTLLKHDALNGIIIVEPLNFAAFSVPAGTDVVVSLHADVHVIGPVSVTVEQGGRLHGIHCRVLALSGATVLAEEGAYVVADNGSFVTAYDCARVEALPGSSVVANMGATVMMHAGSNVTSYAGAAVVSLGGDVAAGNFLNPGLTNSMTGR